MEHAVIPRLELVGITKRYPGIVANDGVGLVVRPGEIHALLGENGAGKSTLVKIIYGVVRPDEGEIRWNGVPVAIANPRAARRLGIGMVFQHFSLFEAMTVLENIALGMDAKIPTRALEGRIRDVLDSYGLSLDPHRVVASLSVGERQRIEIVRALLIQPKLLIMDEPTSVLTPQEVDQLFGTLHQLASEGCSVLYISHKLHEIKALCATATILRNGRLVGVADPKRESSRSLAEKMIGGGLKDIVKPPGRAFGEARLVVNRLGIPDKGEYHMPVRDVGFTVHAGEIFGIAGVAGNGQNALLDALSGEVIAADPQAITLDGEAIGGLGATARRKRGVCAVPEERNGHAAVAEFTLSDNSVLTARDRKGLTIAGFVKPWAARAYTGKVIKDFAVKAQGPGALAGSLSGGNLQKYIMGREILQDPTVLVVSQPTWGVDAGAAAAIHQAIIDLAAKGSAIVVISQDLDELLTLSDHLAVLNEGRLSRTLKVGEASIEELGLLMGGVHGEAHDAPKSAPAGGGGHVVPA